MSAAEAGRSATRGRGLVLGTLCLAALILNLDTTIVNVALPALDLLAAETHRRAGVIAALAGSGARP